eukprot:2702909-Rhodomonas_salina.2
MSQCEDPVRRSRSIRRQMRFSNDSLAANVIAKVNFRVTHRRTDQVSLVMRESVSPVLTMSVWYAHTALVHIRIDCVGWYPIYLCEYCTSRVDCVGSYHIYPTLLPDIAYRQRRLIPPPRDALAPTLPSRAKTRPGW